MTEERIQTPPIQRWNRYFSCPYLHQRVVLKICCHRYAIVLRGAMVDAEGISHPEIVPQFRMCEECYVRRESCSRWLKPNKPTRHPRLDDDGERMLKKLIKKRLRKYGEL
jgi:hypothetical protein